MRYVMHPDMVYDFPIWGVAALVIGVAVAGAVLLELLARFIMPLDRRREQNDVAAALFSVVGVLYAVMLAFITTLVWDGFNTAKGASFREAAAVADIWHVAAGAPAPVRTTLDDAAESYARAVIELEWPAQAAGEAATAGSAAVDTLQQAIAKFQPVSPAEINVHAALLAGLVHLEDMREERLLAAHTTMPGIAWVVMLLGAAITIAYASFLRAPSLAMHLAMAAGLALSGALVLVLVVALNNPFRGDFRVSAEPYQQVLARMQGGR